MTIDIKCDNNCVWVENVHDYTSTFHYLIEKVGNESTRQQFYHLCMRIVWSKYTRTLLMLSRRSIHNNYDEYKKCDNNCAWVKNKECMRIYKNWCKLHGKIHSSILLYRLAIICCRDLTRFNICLFTLVGLCSRKRKVASSLMVSNNVEM